LKVLIYPNVIVFVDVYLLNVGFNAIPASAIALALSFLMASAAALTFASAVVFITDVKASFTEFVSASVIPISATLPAAAIAISTLLIPLSVAVGFVIGGTKYPTQGKNPGAGGAGGGYWHVH
jgi:hypothetical protein